MKEVLYNEKYLINFIRIAPIVLVLFLSFFITKIFIENSKKNLEYEKEISKKDYINHYKMMSANLVNKFHKFLVLEKEFEEKELDKKIKEQIYQAHAIATAIYKNHIKNKNYSKEKTILEIKTALKQMRYNQSLGYMFIYELEGKNILNAEFPKIEGKNLWNYKDAKGTLLLQEMKTLLSKKDETFYEWWWKKNKEDNKQYKKRGFFKKFEPYNLFIGSGDYVDEFEKRVQKKVLEKINSFKLKKPEHIFIYSFSGEVLAHPKKHLLGKNRLDAQNKDGRFLVKELIDFTAKNKSGFTSYYTSVKTNNMFSVNEKTSYLKMYEPWSWMLGSGFYLSDFEKNLKIKEKNLEKANAKAIDEIIFYSVIITLMVMLFSFILSNAIFNIFNNYKLKVKKQMQITLEKEKLLSQQSKMATMGEMIANIAHQWKQPLALISMSNGLIKLKEREKNSLENKAVLNAVENIDNSVKYLSDTMDDFKNFFKPDKEKTHFCFSDVYEKMHKLMKTQFTHNNIEIITNIEDIKLFAYENEFLQVLINLMKNSRDELIKLHYSQRKLLFVNTYMKDDFTYIEIKDNAGGIDKKVFDKIFDAYFTTKKEQDGTGIGLYMSKQLIEAMHGEIKVSNINYEYEDKTYTGAIFTIVLPNR